MKNAFPDIYKVECLITLGGVRENSIERMIPDLNFKDH